MNARLHAVRRHTADPAVACPNGNNLKKLKSKYHISAMSEERQPKVMRQKEKNPEMTQCELAAALDISLGTVNFCLKARVDKGWVKVENFQKSQNKLRYLFIPADSDGHCRQNENSGFIF